MNLSRTLLLAVPLLAVAASEGGDARACGGCFIATAETTQVTGHKMILSISQTRTTLWDEISYSGDPSSFAWVLPIKGTADVELSSDALFGTLDVLTTVSVMPPELACLDFGFGGSSGNGGASGDGGSGGEGGGDPGVTVVSQKVVGPYETVQLSSTDPKALETWLGQHGYNIPSNIAPVVSAYVNEGFDFVALKLVPGAGVSTMRPVRVTTPGASPALPLRMVAAGTGVKTPITLWIMGEGRYESVNLPSFQIDPSALVWDWDTYASNYASLVQDGFTASKNRGWLVEAAEPFSKYDVSNSISNLVSFDPGDSGYGDDTGSGADMEAQADLDALFATIPDTSLWVTRIRGELSRSALVADLQLGASKDQRQVVRYMVPTQTTGTPPCTDGAGGGSGHHGCSAGHKQHASMTLVGGLALGAVSALARRRPRPTSARRRRRG